MNVRRAAGSERPADDGIVRGAVTIVLAGIALGVVFNWLGLSGRPAWGLPWIGEDKVAALESLEDLVPGDEAGQTTGGYGQINDPMAVALGPESQDLPEIPDLDRPVQIGLEAVRRLFDADAAVIVDAREPDEYAAGHIPGSLSMPYDEVTAEPERLEALDAGGRAIVVYCGGGTCEVSLSLAFDLIAAGQSRVVVFMGGYPEWTEAGYPVESGSAAGT
jgi:rhodanese-related sulfurtransferase